MKAVYTIIKVQEHQGFTVETRKCQYKGKASLDFLVSHATQDSAGVFETLDEVYQAIDTHVAEMEYWGEAA